MARYLQNQAAGSHVALNADSSRFLGGRGSHDYDRGNQQRFQSQPRLPGTMRNLNSSRTLGLSMVQDRSDQQEGSSHQGSQSRSPQRSNVERPSNFRFGLNPNTKIGGAYANMPAKGLSGGPMRGIHPKPFARGLKMSKLNDHINKKNEALAKMVLPKITHRKLDEVTDPDAANPFKVQKNTEKLLRFRERQRELEKLESIKQKIEHKYMYGQDLMNNLSQVSPPGKASSSVK